MKSLQAFTLIELLVSITIVSLIAGLSITAYPKFSEQISISAETYKMLGYFRETQNYGIAAVSTPGRKFVYSMLIDRTDGTVKRYTLESPTSPLNSYLVQTSVLDSTAEVNTLKSSFEISEVLGIRSTGTTTLDKAYVFFKRPNPEGKIVGMIGTNIEPGLNNEYFDKLIVTVRSKKNIDFKKQVVVLSTGQMYVNDW